MWRVTNARLEDFGVQFSVDVAAGTVDPASLRLITYAKPTSAGRFELWLYALYYIT